MAKFKKGDVVRQVMPPPVTGTVVGYSVDQETGDVQVRIEWSEKDADGVDHVVSRYFTDAELEPVEAPAA